MSVIIVLSRMFNCSLRQCGLFLAATAVSASGVSAGHGSLCALDADRSQLAAQLLSALESSRSAIVSFEANAIGRKIYQSEQRGDFFSGEVNLLIRNDAAKSKFLFQRDEEFRTLVDRGSENANQAAIGSTWEVVRTGGTLISSPDEDVFIDHAGRILERRHPGTTLGTTVRPFDVRCIGLYLWPDFENGKSLERVMASLRAAVVEDVREVGGGIYELVLATRATRNVLKLDSSHQFVPVGLEVSDKVNPSHVYLNSSVSWTPVGGVLMPENYRIRTFLKGETVDVELCFNWISVNAPLDDSLFAAESAVPGFSGRVVNSRLSSGFIETPPTPRLKERFLSPDQIQSKARHYLWFGNLVLLAVLFFSAMLWRVFVRWQAEKMSR